MKVTWDSRCACCNNPLNIMIITYSLFEDLLWDAYNSLYPVKFENNISMYKFFGIKAKKVCKSCFKDLKKVRCYKNIKLREIGKKMPQMEKSHDQEFIKEWFFKIEHFSKRPNIYDYIWDTFEKSILSSFVNFI
jgi:hypothetical protein